MRTNTTLARTLALALVALGAGACSDAASPVAPVVPSAPSLAKGGPNGLPMNGRIYFTSGLTGGSSEIYSMKSDGTDRQRLTYTSDEYEQDIAVSRDGKKLLVVAQANGVVESRLYAMNADGTNRRFVTSLPGGVITDPAWSPDGRTIAYVARPGGASEAEIWTISSNGGKATRLTPTGQRSGWPSWSPDGARIVYAATPEGETNRNLYIMNANGSNPQLLYACNPGCSAPVWSPDAGQVVFAAMDGIMVHVRTCIVQSTPLCGLPTGIDLTSSLTFDLSPDGSQIAYMSSESGIDRIGTANLNGSAQTFVTPDLKPIFDLAWGR
jgi:TolB protein